MTPLRLSIVTETYLPDINGVANSLAQMLGALDPEKYQLQIIRPRPKAEWTPHCEEVWCKGISIPMYPDLQLGWPAQAKVQEAWERFQPDLVFLVTEGPLSWSALKLAQEKGLPVLSAFHTNFHRYSGYYGLAWIKSLTLSWLRHFHNRTRRTLVPAGEVASALSEQGFQRIEVLPHGVDCELFNPKRRSSTLRKQWQAEDEPVWLYVGRVAAEKNIPLALASYRQAKQEYPDLKMVVVGDGPLKDKLSKEYPDVIFAGVKTGYDLARYYASADYFIFPSLTETYGLVTTEALASGLPVVAFDAAAAAMHVKNGLNGYLAAVDDNQHVADQAFMRCGIQVMRLDQNELSIAARQAAEQNSWAAVAEQFASLLHSELESAAIDTMTLVSENS
jgi:glycosyltransferase involved in cell wall biosynthesis